ncbi:MAG: hypothetical protein GC159_10885 [Phycisphaera sp.]|nr:hypothetical protein [Phycisphaera sp.]
MKHCLKFTILFSACVLGLGVSAGLAENQISPEIQTIRDRYQAQLIASPDDYRNNPLLQKVYEQELKRFLEKSVQQARKFDYPDAGKIIVSDHKVFKETALSQEDVELMDSNKVAPLFSQMYILAAAYQIPGTPASPNPFYHSKEILDLYVKELDYLYGRGLTEHAWFSGMSFGGGTRLAEKTGWKLPKGAGDFSILSQRMGGYVKSAFLMRNELESLGLAPKYLGVIRNFASESAGFGGLFSATFELCPKEVVAAAGGLPSESDRYRLNSDQIRNFYDLFMPYFLMETDQARLRKLSDILDKTVRKSIAVAPGVEDVFKLDGTVFHHASAYYSSYAPYAMETCAALLNLFRGTRFCPERSLEVVKNAIETYRIVSQKYSVPLGLRGRLIHGNATQGVVRAMAYVGEFDQQVAARFLEFSDPNRMDALYVGKRGNKIQSLGIFNSVNAILHSGAKPAEPPQGFFAKPFAASAFYRQDRWLASIKGFSRYFWDYEGPLNKHQNVFGQNVSYGLLQIFSHGNPVNDIDSGYDLGHGWDWYHAPGTTASHYPIVKRTLVEAQEKRKKMGDREGDGSGDLDFDPDSVQHTYNSRTFVGGCSLGDAGVFALDLEAVPFTSPTDLAARKTWFCAGGLIVAVGTDIKGGTQADETQTTLFQTKLSSPDSPTQIDGERLTGLMDDRRFGPGAQVRLTDSAENSYLVLRSTSPLVVTRSMQHSMDEDYQATQGEYASAFLNHGIKPVDDSYQYVVIPHDPGAERLKALAGDVDSYCRVVQSKGVHVVEFPREKTTGYAFYELVETPDRELVKTVSTNAVVMARDEGAGRVALAVCVPDLGFEKAGQATAEKGKKDDAGEDDADGPGELKGSWPREYEVDVCLRGAWKVGEHNGPDSPSIFSGKGQTHVRLKCKGGFSERVDLVKN